MIELTKKSGEKILVNKGMIERIEEQSHDVAIYFFSRPHAVLIQEPFSEVKKKIEKNEFKF
jgi:uncharacterized protein YlzI (FlbEa/FlbD family)